MELDEQLSRLEKAQEAAEKAEEWLKIESGRWMRASAIREIELSFSGGAKINGEHADQQLVEKIARDFGLI